MYFSSVTLTPGDVRFKGLIEAMLAGVNRPVHPHNLAKIPGSQLSPKLHFSIPNSLFSRVN